MELAFDGVIVSWRGPAPYHFVRVPDPDAEIIQAASAVVTYGWGMIPVTAGIGATEWTTSLFPKDGGYLLPIKDAVRRVEQLEVGSPVAVRLTVDA